MQSHRELLHPPGQKRQSFHTVSTQVSPSMDGASQEDLDHVDAFVEGDAEVRHV